MLTPNTRLASGRYIIQRQLGAGAMAEVYLAKDCERRVDVAIKVLLPKLALDPQYAQYFRDEAKVLEKLQHPNIVRYFDYRQERQLVFIALEYIAGPTLQHYLSHRKLLAMPHAFYIAACVASALDYAHNQGVIHRDIKPSNVMLADSGKVLLNDFGVARAASGGPNAAGPIGTMAYMAPEQIRGINVTAAADQYSLAILLWELLTGRRPFTADSAGLQGATTQNRLAEEHLNYPPPGGILPEAESAPLMRALAKNPNERFPNCTALVKALLAASGQQPTNPQQWMQALRTFSPPARISAPAPTPQQPPPAFRPAAAQAAQRLIPKPSIPKFVLYASALVAILLLLAVFKIGSNNPLPAATAVSTAASTPALPNVVTPTP